MKKAKSFLVFILVFSILVGLALSKASAATGHYATVTTQGYSTTFINPGYSTTGCTHPGVWASSDVVLPGYYVKGIYVYGYVSHTAVWISPVSTRVWHPATSKLVWHPAVTHKVWVTAP